MQSSFMTAVLLPVALGVIMLGLGLSLTTADFRRVVRYPRAMLVGLACQMLVMPAICYLIARAFHLSPELAVGLMLLAASPGGATANLFSHLARGDVALNITLTAVNSVLCLATLPFIVNLSMSIFMGEGKEIPLPFEKVVQVFVIVLGPTALGMALRRYLPGAAARLSRPVKILSAAFLLLVVAASIARERHNVAEFAEQIGAAALAFNLASMLIGYVVPRLFQVESRQSISIGMEIGIHNATLAMTIASSPLLLNNSIMAIPGAVYGVVMLFTAAAFGYLMSRRA